MMVGRYEVTQPATDVRLLAASVIWSASLAPVLMPSPFGCFLAVVAIVNSHTAWLLYRKTEMAA